MLFVVLLLITDPTLLPNYQFLLVVIAPPVGVLFLLSIISFVLIRRCLRKCKQNKSSQVTKEHATTWNPSFENPDVVPADYLQVHSSQTYAADYLQAHTSRPYAADYSQPHVPDKSQLDTPDYSQPDDPVYSQPLAPYYSQPDDPAYSQPHSFAHAYTLPNKVKAAEESANVYTLPNKPEAAEESEVYAVCR